MIDVLKFNDIFLKKLKKYLMLYRRGEDDRMYLLKELGIKIINEDDINLKNTCVNNHTTNQDDMIQNINNLYNKIKYKTVDKIENEDYDNILRTLQNMITYFEL